MPSISAKAFAAALDEIPKRKGKQKDFLRTHRNAPHRALTPTMMAEAVGYDGYRGINRHYGQLALDLGMALGYPDEGLSLLCEFVRPKTLTNTEWILVMRPEFAEGLRLAGWV